MLNKFSEVSGIKEYIFRCRACRNTVIITTELLPCPHCDCKTLALEMVRRRITKCDANEVLAVGAKNT